MRLWIVAKEIVVRNIGLEIGKDITLDEARMLMRLNCGDYAEGTEEFERLDGLLSAHSSDVSEGFIDVDITFKEEAGVNQ